MIKTSKITCLIRLFLPPSPQRNVTILSFLLLIIFLSCPGFAYEDLLFCTNSQSTSLFSRRDAAHFMNHSIKPRSLDLLGWIFVLVKLKIILIPKRYILEWHNLLFIISLGGEKAISKIFFCSLVFHTFCLGWREEGKACSCYFELR